MSTMQITEIPIGDLRENPNNPRRHIDPKKLDELAASIREKGIRQPLEVRQVDVQHPDFGLVIAYEVVFGNRRFKAAQLAGLTVVPAIIRELTDDEAFEIAVTENVQRDDMTALDEAGAYDALVKRGSTVAAVAARFGKNESHVYRRIKLLQLVDEVQAALDEGRLTLGHAERLARMSPALQREAFDVHNGCVWDYRPFLVAGDSDDDETLGLDNLRPVHELDAFMRRKMAIAPSDPDLQHFQPELAEAVDAAALGILQEHPLAEGEFQDEEDLATAKASLVELSEDIFVKRTLSHLEGQALPLGKSRWHEIAAKKDECEHMQRGMVTHGGQYRVVEKFCAKKGCSKHFPVAPKKPAAERSAATDAEPKAAAKPAWKVEQERREAEQKAWDAIFPIVALKLAEHLQGIKFDAALVKLALETSGHGYRELLPPADIKRQYGVALSDKTAALVLALGTVDPDDREGFLRTVKPFKFNLSRVEQQIEKAKKASAAIDAKAAKRKGKVA